MYWYVAIGCGFAKNSGRRGEVEAAGRRVKADMSRACPALAAASARSYRRALLAGEWAVRMHAVLNILLLVIRIYIWLLIAQAILSWLLAFGVVNRYNRGVAVIGDFLYRVTEPALRPIRAFLPNFGGIDISPIILILILYFLSDLIVEDIAPHLLF
jgi:YggT family protein